MKKFFYRVCVNKTILFMLVLIVALVSVCFGIFTNKVSAAGDAAIYFDQATATANIGDTVTLIARVNPGTSRVSVADLSIAYDQSILQLNSITMSSAFTTQLKKTIPNPANGTAFFSAGIMDVDPPYISTTSDVATFIFTALADGTTSVIFGSKTLAAYDGTNVTGSVTGSAVTVGTPAAVTYTATDFSNLLANWLQTVSGGREVGNVNTDNVVNTRDLGIMMSNWAE